MTLTGTPSEHFSPRATHPWRTEPPHDAAPVPHSPCYRSEAFAEDLVDPADTLRVHAPRQRRRATLLFFAPLGAAFLGSVLPLLKQLA